MKRREKLLDANPYCRMCLDKGLEVLAQEVDHVIPLHAGGPDIDSNTQNLCIPCHAAKSRRDGSLMASNYKGLRRQNMDALLHPATLRPSRIPLTIVCGPAGGGKSTYIQGNKSSADIIIDMDMIRAELGIGSREWDTRTLERSLERRNELLASLAQATAPRAWFIVSAASSAERAWWRQALQPESVVVVMADEQECISRISRTRTGERAERSIKAASKWWQEYTQSSDDQIIKTDAEKQ